MASTASRATAVSEAEVLRPFVVAEIEPAKVSFLYTASLIVVGVLMVLLVGLYVAMIAAAAYGTIYHATHVGWMSDVDSVRAVVIGYLAPLIAGVALVFFMVKPLLARPSKREWPVMLDPAREPLLFGLVEKLARAMGAPVPRQIHIDTDINASASFRRGMLSFFGSDLVLTIGMPLLGGLTVRQFVGVLAHELGHFSQGAGMRVSYLIRTISFWFVRVVYHRDQWDDRLRRWQQTGDIYVLILILPARGMIWLTRKILWVLMHISFFVSSVLMRQMEYDADRYEAVVAGSGSFASTFQRLAVLGAANNGAMHDLNAAHRERRLPNDLPALILANLTQIPADVQKKIAEEQSKEKTSLLATHPCYSDRVRAAERQNQPGLFTLEFPAQKLLREYAMLCRAVTHRFYSDGLGEDLSGMSMIDTANVVREQQAVQEEFRQAGRYFQGLLSANCPLLLNYIAQPIEGDLQPAIDCLMESRSRMQQQYPAAQAAFNDYIKACAELTDGRCNQVLLDSGFSYLVDATGAKISRGQHAANQGKNQAKKTEHGPMMSAYQELAKQRLMAALALLVTDRADLGFADLAARRRVVTRCLAALRVFAEIFPATNHLRDVTYAANMLLGNLKGNEQNDVLIAAITKRLAIIREELMRFRRELLNNAEYPFPQRGAPETLADYAVAKIAGENELELINQAGGATENLGILYFRCLATVTATAEAVENALGLPPLPQREEAMA